MTSASERSVDKVSFAVDREHSGTGERSDTASSSSSFSIITLKESPDEADFHGRLSSLPETASASQVQVLESSERQQQLDGSEYPPYSMFVPSVTATQSVADTLFSSHCDTGVVCDKTITIFVYVDRLERRMVVKKKPKLKITELTAEMFCYSPSFRHLPAIVESLRSDDGPLSDVSIASGDGYVADEGHMRSESCLSNASSPSRSSHNVAASAECNDFRYLRGQQRSACIGDNLSEHQHHLECPSSSPDKMDTVVSDRRQLSAKSSSDGIDSAVVCTPYSTQTSQDSTDTVDNARDSCCHLVSDVTDDQAPQLPLSAVDRVHPIMWENNEIEHPLLSRTANEAACRESFEEDSDDKTSVTSLKVEWEVGSDDEMPVHCKSNVVDAPSIEPTISFVPRLFPNAVGSARSLQEQVRDVEGHWSDKPVARQTCCACLSSVIARHCMPTAADVTPTISIRLCSSVVDVICLLQRLVIVSSTWLQVVCESASGLQRFCRSHGEQFTHETAIMCPTSTDHAATNTGTVCESGIVAENAHLQHHSFSEGLENVRESRLRQLISVSDSDIFFVY